MRTELNAPVCSTEPDLWFSEDTDDRRKAKALCLTCPLMVECREYGKGQEYGVWGGRLATQRSSREIAREQKQQRNAEIAALHRDGHSFWEIGKRLGISHVTASSVIRNAA